MGLKRKTADGWEEVSSISRAGSAGQQTCEWLKRWDGSQWQEIWGGYYQAISSKKQTHQANSGTEQVMHGGVTVSENQLTAVLEVSWVRSDDPDEDSTYGSASVSVQEIPVGATVTFDYRLVGFYGSYSTHPKVTLSGCSPTLTYAQKSAEQTGSYSGASTSSTVQIRLSAGCTTTQVEISNLKIGGRRVRFCASV